MYVLEVLWIVCYPSFLIELKHLEDILPFHETVRHKEIRDLSLESLLSGFIVAKVQRIDRFEFRHLLVKAVRARVEYMISV
jgi:hypothetical protein